MRSQRRLILASLLSALPLAGEDSALYHPKTWALTEEGETTVSVLRRCWVGLFDELAAVFAGGAEPL